jgi:hypothetical protein
MSRLAEAPGSVVVDGTPAHGRYAGGIDRLDWRGLDARNRRNPLWMRLHHKRWHYLGIGNERLFIGVAIVDIGWTGTAFAYLFDRRQRRLLADWSQDGLPGLQVRVGDAPLRGANAKFRGWRSRLDLQARDGALQLQVEIPGLHLQAELAMPQSPPLLAIGPIAGGIAHATLKTSALGVQGWAEAGGERFPLDGATAALDASNGLLARDTAWRWASAHSPQLGFNLQQGYFGAQENALWLDGELIPLAAAEFAFDPKTPLAPWRLRTEDGLLDLSFTPEGLRAEDRNLGIAASHYVQPIGRFDGWVRASAQAPAREVAKLLGVTEDHRSRW